MGTMIAPTRNGISVDLEDWFSLVRRRVWGRDEPPTERVIVGTRRLLELFGQASTRATFFVLGQVAETFPDLVREIRARGHELGSHGHGHWRLDAIGPERFREELQRSTAAIERAAGVRPVGHRAPEFSITPATPWAFEVLASEGFRYDSSVFPIRHPRYGVPDAPTAPYFVRSGLREFPLATLELAGRRIPAAGGGYLRFLPYTIIERAVKQANARGHPAIVYIHPYEFDPEPLRFADSLPTLRARVFVEMQNAFRHRAASRLSRLLETFEFGPLGELP
jgi:polysaccharide deacetylase family protein (PEP-CTERM system associated)